MSDVIIQGGTVLTPEGEIPADLAESATEDVAVAMDAIPCFIEPLAEHGS